MPQLGFVRSLNVHVSGAIAVWMFARQVLLKAAGPAAGDGRDAEMAVLKAALENATALVAAEARKLEARSAEAAAPAPAPFSLELDIGTPEQKARGKAILKAERERFVAENGREPTTTSDILELIQKIKNHRV